MSRPIDPITWYLYQQHLATTPPWDAPLPEGLYSDHEGEPCILIESTAQGLDNTFYDHCQRLSSTQAAHSSPWRPLFLPWSDPGEL